MLSDGALANWSKAMGYLKVAATLSMIGAMSLSTYQPALAAPLTPLSSAIRPAADQDDQNNIVQVRYGWHGGWGWGVGAGLLAGALIGAAIAAPAYGAYYPYGSGFGYSYPYSYGYGGYYPGGYGPYAYAPHAYRPYAYRSYAYRPYVRPFAGYGWRHSYGWQRPHAWRHSYGMYRVHRYR
jgi:hypothetical protein